MAGSVGGALAEGIERGMGLGFQIQDRERQAAQDKRRQEDADRQFGLDQQRYDQQMARQTAADDRATQAERRKLLDDEHTELVSTVQGMQQAGQQVPPELAQRISANATSRREYRDKVLRPALAAERQQHLDTFARIQAGEIDPATLPGADLYRGLSLVTGRTPEQILDSVQGAQQVQQGFEAKNQGMLLEGVNKLFAPDLRAGVGSESPYGGEIVRKEIVHLLPAKDANGQAHPDKVMPVVRVYVRRQDAVGPAMEGGAFGYYDAPLTENRSTDPNDTVKVVDLANAFDYMGKLGSLAAVLQNPVMQAKLAEGAKEVGEQTKADVDAITAMGYAKLKPEDRMLMQLNEEQRAQAAQVKAGLAAKAKEDPAGVQRDQARLDEIRRMVARGDITPGVGRRMEASLLSGAHSGLGMSYIETGKLPEKAGKGAKGAGLGGSAGGQAAGGGFSFNPGERLAAAKALVTGQMPYRQAAAVNRLYAAQEALMKEAGLTTADVVKQGDAFKIKAGAAQDLEKMYAAVESFSKTVDLNMKVLEDLSNKLPRSDIPIISKGTLAVQSFTGNPVMSQYRGAMQSVATEVARLITQPRLTGQLTESARKEIKHFMNEDMTHAQLMALMKTLRTEAKNREAGILAMRETIQSERTGVADKLGGTAPAATGRGVNARAGGLPKTTPGGATVSNW